LNVVTTVRIKLKKHKSWVCWPRPKYQRSGGKGRRMETGSLCYLGRPCVKKQRAGNVAQWQGPCLAYARWWVWHQLCRTQTKEVMEFNILDILLLTKIVDEKFHKHEKLSSNL
jgi:hypothetical protein